MKTKDFSVILRVFCLVLALGIGLVSCKEPGTGNNDGDGGKAATYTVSFNANGGSGAVPDPITVNAGSSINLPNGDGLSKSGYTFGGWSNNDSGTGNVYQPGSSYTPGISITLYAKWNPVANSTTYTVTFNANGGSGTPPAEQVVNAGSSITLPNSNGLTKTDYTFGGWNTNTEGTGTNYSAGSSFTPTGHVTLYAKWNDGTITTYTVTFDANGGSGTPPAEQVVNAGSSITLPNGDGLTKSGYTFSGWNTNTEGTGEDYGLESSFTPTGHITLYAKWNDGTIITYTVTFNANGGSGTPPAEQVVNAGSSITLPSGNELIKTDHTFSGWNTNIYGTGEDYGVGASYTPTGSIILYAKWFDVPTRTVMFETNGGSPVGDAVILPNTAVSRPTPNPTKTGYTFNDWFSNPELTVAYNFSSIVFTSITLYAKWNPITYTVSYNKNNSAATGTMQSSSHTYDVDQNLNANAFYRKGYYLAGWARTTTGEIEFTDEESVKNLRTATGTLTLYAQWQLNLGITLDIKQITEGAPIFEDITISRTGSNGYGVTFEVSVNVSDYDAGSISWEVAGVGAYASETVTGTGASFTLDAEEVKYNSLGGHALILTIKKGGMDYQRAIPFTIVQ